MKTRTTVMSAAALAAAITIMGPIKPSEAGSCPSPAVAGSRVFTVDPGSCLASGPGNPSVGDIGSNYVLLDKTDEAGNLIEGALQGIGTSGLGGNWSLNTGLLGGYTSFVLALKSGEGTLDPDWAAFLLGGTSGTWSISGTQQLSHANLYARVVPIPAALPLMLGALAGLGLIARRKKDV